MKTLTIRLAGPLQSYGNQANFKYRTTYRHPSKSAVLGMVAAALGYRHSDSRIPKLNKLAFAVRTDQINKVLTDFHNIHVDNKNSPKLTFRDYLMDAVFVVAIGGPDQQIEHIEYALHHPKFPLFLGRKSTPPAGVLKTKIYIEKDPVEVLKRVPWQASHWFMRKQRFVSEWRAPIHADASLLPDQPNSLVKDTIGSFSLKQRYHTYRSEAVTTVQLPNPFKHFDDATSQDVMAFLK